MASQEADWKSALVLTGVVTDSGTIDPVPDLVARDLAEVARTLLG